MNDNKKINLEKSDTSSSDNDNDNDNETNSSDTLSNKKNEIIIENPNTFFNQKELCHYKNINKFFIECYKEKPEIIMQMIDIIESKSNISLRILDWFVTKYSKKKINCNGNIKNVDAFDVKISYKAQLKAYKKRYFDPFRRRKKFFYPCEKDGFIKLENESKYIYTTLGQLNFFKWAFTNGIVSYVDENLNFIISEMNAFNKDEKKKKIQNLNLNDGKKIINTGKINNLKDVEKNKNIIKNKEKEMKFVITFE